MAGLLAAAVLGATAEVSFAQSQRELDEFLVTFTFGWGGDDMWPSNQTKAAQLAQEVAGANFTTVLANYEPWKLELFRQHGLKFMINMYGDAAYDMGSNPSAALALAQTLTNDPDLWGYCINWDLTGPSDTSAASTQIDQLHSADPNHPVVAGSKWYAWPYTSYLQNPDVLSFYYYIWTRDYKQNFSHLYYWRLKAQEKGVPLLRMMWVPSGITYEGHLARDGYTLYTSLAYGVKGAHWFIGEYMINPDTLQWTVAGEAIKVLNANLSVLGPEVMDLTSMAVLSTPTTLCAKGRPKDPGEPDIPDGLSAIPADHWMQVTAGEVVLGMFDDDTGDDIMMVVNHRAYDAQDVVLEFAEPLEWLKVFNQDTGAWEKQTVDIAGDRQAFGFLLGGGYGELMRAERVPGAPILGDANRDGIVDAQDFTFLKAAYGQPGAWGDGNFNCDDLIDGQDFSILKRQFGERASAPGLPEPTALISLLAGSLLLIRRRKK